MRKRRVFKIVVLTIMAFFAFLSSLCFVRERTSYDTFVPSSSYSYTVRLSDYDSSLLGTKMDAPVFVFDSGIKGADVFIMGGTHPNESGGILSAIIIMENIELESGRVFVLPVANMSAYLNTLPGYGYPEYYTLQTEWGEKSFKVGSRVASPLDQWPDPPFYVHYPSAQRLSYEEARNINRTFPGRRNGSPLERASNAIMTLLEKEGIDYAFDLHEASVTYPVNLDIVAPEISFDIAYLSALMLEEKGISLRVEATSSSNKGYTHSEWARVDGVHPFLIEVPTPFIDRTPGAMTGKMIVSGKDEFLYKVAEYGYSGVDYPEDGISISERVAIHVATIDKCLEIAGQFNPDNAIEIKLPSYEEIKEKGVGFFLHEEKEGNYLILK